MQEDQGLVVAERAGRAGVIRLNRPKALNALDLGMVRAFRMAFETFLSDQDVGLVILEAEGERAFCAGGDIRAVAASGRAGDGVAEAFWREEYELIARLATSPKPVIALTDGIVMGGGAGLVMHLRHRVATEHVRFAMPEVGIGFLPDVGATYALPRLPAAFGRYLALTGEAVGVGDALAAGLFDHCVPRERLSALRTELTQLPLGAGDDAVSRSIAANAVPQDAPLHVRHGTLIEEAFGQEELGAIGRGLGLSEGAAEQGDFATRTLETMRSRSPWSMALTQALLREGERSRSLTQCLAREFRAASYCLEIEDFHEGVRAAVIDKDRNPVWPSQRTDWRQPSLEEVLAERAGRPDPTFAD